MRNHRTVEQVAQVRFYRGGVLTQAPLIYIPDPPKGKKRGKIREWSKESRMRLRRFLLENEPTSPAVEANITLTVPGPPLTPDQARELWKGFCRDYEERGWSAVWRLEVQRRGSVHWHMVCAVPHSEAELAVQMAKILWGITDLWAEKLKALGPCVHEIKGRDFSFKHRMMIPGADEHAVNVQFAEKHSGDRWAWRRYMQDHASKGKQEQIAEGFGRHWGVIGRKGYCRQTPDSAHDLKPAQFYAFLRWAQRLVSGTIKAPGKPFGRKRAHRQMRGTMGKSVWFSRVETMNRLVELARTIP